MAISVDDFSPTLQDSTVVELPCGKPTLFFDQAQDSWAIVGLSGRLEDLCRDLRRSVESPGRVEAWEKSLCVSKKKWCTRKRSSEFDAPFHHEPCFCRG